MYSFSHEVYATTGFLAQRHRGNTGDAASDGLLPGWFSKADPVSPKVRDSSARISGIIFNNTLLPVCILPRSLCQLPALAILWSVV